MTLATGLVASLCVSAALLLLLLRQRSRERGLHEQLARARGELERMELAFTRFAPDEVVEGVIAAGARPGGERREVTALFSDLVGSTALAEAVAPSVLIEILNGYFERMSRVITAHHGHLSSLIGDGMLALFGALRENPWHSQDACRAAIAMRASLAEYNQELRAKGLPALRFGIGIHRGTGVAGLVGSAHLMQFTVVGTTVSIAARVQQLTRDHAVDALVTQAVRDQLDPRFAVDSLGAASLRGISEAIGIWSLKDLRD